jgi:hypothetical protein
MGPSGCRFYVVTEGFDCAVRVGVLPDSSLVARRIAPLRGMMLASPAYVRARGTPQTLEDLQSHDHRR